MKIKTKTIFVLVIAFIMLSSIVLTPETFALGTPTEKNRTEQVRTQIENGFGNYIQAKNIQLYSTKSAESAFSDFLKKNPIYQTFFTEYANLTRPDISKIIPNYQPTPFKTSNVTVKGVTYQVSYSNEISADEKTFVQATICDSTSEGEIYVEIIPQTIPILGFDVQYGEDDVLGVRYAPGGPSEDFKSDFDQQIVNAAGLLAIIIAASTLYFALSPEPVSKSLAGILDFVSVVSAAEIAYMTVTIDDNINEYGAQLCFENYWVYASFLMPFNIFNDFKLWSRHHTDTQDTWDIAFPHFTYPIHFMLSGWQSEAIAWGFSHEIHAVGDIMGYDAWNSTAVTYPSATPEVGSTGLLYRSVNTVDDQENSIASNVYIDGSLAGSNNPSLILTPETHYVRVDRFIPTSGGYGYMFTAMMIEGNNYYDPEVEVELSTNATITAHYTYGLIPTCTLIVCAYDAYTYELYPNVYVDGNYVGTAPLSIQVTADYHTIELDYQTYDPWWSTYANLAYVYGYPYYNGGYSPIFSDTTIVGTYY